MAKRQPKHQQNIAEPGMFPEQPAGKERSSRKTAVALTVFGAVLLLLIAAFAWVLSQPKSPEDGYILENVTVSGVEIGNLLKEDASALLKEKLEANFQQTITVKFPDSDVPLYAETAKPGADFDRLIEDAYQLGRSKDRKERKQQLLQAKTVGYSLDIQPYILYDEDALFRWCQLTATRHTSKFAESSVEIVGEAPQLETATEETPGQTLILSKGTPGQEISKETLFELVSQAYLNTVTQVEYHCDVTEPKGIDIDALYQQLYVEPVDAQMNPDTFEVSAHTMGYRFDLESAKSALKEAKPGEVLKIPVCVFAPENTQESLLAELYKDVLGSYTAKASSIWGRDINLRLSCEAINGKIVLPGEVFSYNPALGKRVPEKGWQKADGYVGNATVSEYGGGICQASSCLYLSAMLADLEIVERTNHGFISSYMPYGMDATVSWGGPEFLFRNNTAYPIKIEAYSDKGTVTVKLLGTDTKDYYVKMDYEILGVYPFETVTREMTADNPDGYTDGQVIITPYTGYKIATYRCKYNKETDELISRDLEATSNYSRRDRVICKIVEPDPPADSTPPETTPSEDIPPESTESTEPSQP